MTERLYYRDAGLLAFDANIIALGENPLHIVLDRTAFYPTSGGQPHDVGVLGTARVVDVIDEDERIIHVLDAPLPLGPVRGVVDGARRRDLMEQHTAQHLLSALAGDRLRWETTSVHFGAEHSTIEFATPAASDRQLADLQRWANEIVGEARPISITFEDAVTAEAAGLRKPSGRVGEIRIVTIDGIDRSACGGTHLSRTSEIGAVMLLDVEKIRGHVRIGFLAGGRVLAHTRDSDMTLAALAATLGCAINQLEEIVSARQQSVKELRDQVSTLEQEVATARVRAMYDATSADADGVRRIMHNATTDSATLLRAMAQAIASLERARFVAIGGTPATLYFAASSDSGVDAGAVLKPVLAAVGGRGGGSPRVAQGTAPSADLLATVAASALQA